MTPEINYRSVLSIAESVRHALSEAGVKAEMVEDICHRLTMAAGSLLPPVGGTLHVKFDDTRMN